MIHFPKDFTWGSATSCYQIEGGWLEGGKGLSIWDVFAHTPGTTHRGQTGDKACDHYHRWQEDVASMADMGLPAYRFSISWPRIQPDGTGRPNPEGIRFYSNLIDALLAKGITPWVTLHHWDMPASLQMAHDGWLHPRSADIFADFASICFEHFGDRVKHWITFNEPWVIAVLGYGQGVFAPGRVSNREPYLAAHNLLLAHAKAVQVYRSQFQPAQSGIIGISNNCDWREPRSSSESDQAAAERALEFFLGWFADPVYYGDYPESMRQRVGERLPHFTVEERELLTGSSDYFGLNHYTTLLAGEAPPGLNQNLDPAANAGLSEDQDVFLTSDPAWEKTSMDWAIVPWGCRKLLEWIDRRYDRPDIFLTENGCAFEDNLADGAVDDQQRIQFLKGYLAECAKAIDNGVKLKGYFVWSFLDNFEWAQGYTKRFGLHHVDFETGKRTPKASAKWFAEVIRQNGVEK